jgi:RNA-directed DNA polymerase
MTGKGRTLGGFGILKDSKEIQRKQKTQSGGWPQEARVELGDNAGVLSISTASERERNVKNECAGRLLENILDRENLNLAFKRVKSNKGSHGVDGMKVDELLPFLKQNGETIKQKLLEGSYRPTPVRRVEIPKPDGGVRLLGIPTVLDRWLQQAVAQVLSPIFEEEFSPNSYGFRPGRSAKQAVEAARKHIENGYKWAVDLDLEKFFDRVNHDKLMSQVAKKVQDKRVLKLIRLYLESGVMINGVKVESEEGCPQGGPLSPLLSNIMLDSFDKELERRGHKFCRYADDSNVYVKSRRAGERVMRSVTKYLEETLKLKVNREKSAVERPEKRKFLGFSFYYRRGGVGIRVHEKPVMKFKLKIKEITSRSNAQSMEQRITKLNQTVIGWTNYFGIADMRNKALDLDEWIRRRLRMCYWKQWKKIKARHDNLVKLGVENYKAWEFANTRKGYWRISNSPILAITLTNKYFEKLGVQSLTKRYSLVH